MNRMVIDTSIERTEDKQKRIESFGFLILIFVCILFCGYFAASAFLESQKSFNAELDGRINPNYAPVESLMRLAGVGRAKAEAIAAYRGNVRAEGKGQLVFQGLDDLQKVKGIGPKTAANMSKWLKFE